MYPSTTFETFILIDYKYTSEEKLISLGVTPRRASEEIRATQLLFNRALTSLKMEERFQRNPPDVTSVMAKAAEIAGIEGPFMIS